MNSKGQSAMEYLMTYGWAILVIMVVGIAMWNLGIFNMGSSTVSATGFGKIKPQLAATGYSSEGKFTIVLTNTVGTRIVLSEVGITDHLGNTMGCGDSYGENSCCAESIQIFLEKGFIANSGEIIIPPGENFPIIITAGHESFEGDPACPDLAAPLGRPGNPYTVEFYLKYHVWLDDIIVENTVSGTIKGPLE
jgi:uncharacterized protein (UPF0333 family)